MERARFVSLCELKHLESITAQSLMILSSTDLHIHLVNIEFVGYFMHTCITSVTLISVEPWHFHWFWFTHFFTLVVPLALKALNPCSVQWVSHISSWTMIYRSRRREWDGYSKAGIFRTFLRISFSVCQAIKTLFLTVLPYLAMQECKDDMGRAKKSKMQYECLFRNVFNKKTVIHQPILFCCWIVYRLYVFDQQNTYFIVLQWRFCYAAVDWNRWHYRNTFLL